MHLVEIIPSKRINQLLTMGKMSTSSYAMLLMQKVEPMGCQVLLLTILITGIYFLVIIVLETFNTEATIVSRIFT
jgi:hypothetical protein